jgi:hypothetical protein
VVLGVIVVSVNENEQRINSHRGECFDDGVIPGHALVTQMMILCKPCPLARNVVNLQHQIAIPYLHDDVIALNDPRHLITPRE